MASMKRALTVLGMLSVSSILLHSADSCSKWVVINIDAISAVVPACDSAPAVPALDPDIQDIYLSVINEARSKEQDCGEYGIKPAVPALKWSDTLYRSAYRHSYDLAKTNTFSHTGSGTETDVAAQALHPGTGSTVQERIEYEGYTDWKAYGENLAAGTVMDEAQEAIDAWLSSPGHCINLMSPNFTEVGMAHVFDADSHYTHYWAQDFGKR